MLITQQMRCLEKSYKQLRKKLPRFCSTLLTKSGQMSHDKKSFLQLCSTPPFHLLNYLIKISSTDWIDTIYKWLTACLIQATKNVTFNYFESNTQLLGINKKNYRNASKPPSAEGVTSKSSASGDMIGSPQTESSTDSSPFTDAIGS